MIFSISALKSQPRWETNVLSNNYIKFIYSVNSDLYALTEYGIYFSTDHGNFWSSMIIDTSLTSFQANYDVEVMTNIGNRVFIASPYSGIFSTNDYGATWSALNNGLGDRFVYSIISKGSLLFAGTSDSGVYYSSNQGLNWTAVNSGLTNLEVNAFAIDGDKLFAGTYGGVFLSTNNGESWIPKNSGLTSLRMESLFFNDGDLFAGTRDSGIYLSTNSGMNWSKRNSGLTSYWVTCFNYLNNYLFAGTYYGGIFTSTNNGESWSQANSGFGSIPIVSSLLSYEGNILAGSLAHPKGIYFTNNLGISWNQINSGLTDAYVRCLFGNSMEIMTGSSNPPTLFKTTNNGSNWENAGIITSTGAVNSMVHKPPYYFATILYSGIFRSPDNTFNWTKSGSGANSLVFNDIVVKGNNIFSSSGDSGIYKSTDNGNNWITVNSGLSNLYVYSLVVSGNNLIAGTQNGIFYSTNDGISWVQSQTPVSRVYSMITIGSNTYSASTANGIYSSSDNGLSWEPRNSGLTDLNFSVISGNEKLLIVYGNSGVYISTDKGISWTPYNLGRFWSTYFLKFYINDEYVFASSISGVYRLKYLDLVDINDITAGVPGNYFLYQNFPNPFNPITKIKFQIPMSSFVKLRIYDILGKEIQTVIDKSMNTGTYTVDFNNANLPSGIYFYGIEVKPDNSNEIFSDTRRMILLK